MSVLVTTSDDSFQCLFCLGQRGISWPERFPSYPGVLLLFPFLFVVLRRMELGYIWMSLLAFALMFAPLLFVGVSGEEGLVMEMCVYF